MMGSPELPQDDQSDFNAASLNSVFVDDMDNASEASDDSDNEAMDYGYAGYQPLPGDDELNTVPMNVEDDQTDEQQVFCHSIIFQSNICANDPIFDSRRQSRSHRFLK